ncbi:MAG: hypothetical protein ACP5L5_11410 [Vulcanisaeta sp.]|uniref:hypothetical protein n=1 Tax=Vulcanisaeta sp. TaxID=2020871 RepID=UPI003D0EDC2C
MKDPDVQQCESGSDSYSVIKLDIDFKVPKWWIAERAEIAKFIVEQYYGIKVNYVNYARSKHGWHMWVVMAKPIDYCLYGRIKFMLGDDINRVKYHFIREDFTLRDKFDLLFNEKRKYQSKA